MESERWTLAFIAFGVVTIAGSILGLVRPSLAGLFIRMVIAGYVLLLVVTASWGASCSSCDSVLSADSTHSLDLMAAIFWGGLFASVIIAFTLMASAVGRAVRHLMERR